RRHFCCTALVVFVQPIDPVRKPTTTRFQEGESNTRKLFDYASTDQTGQRNHLFKRVAQRVSHKMGIESLRSCCGQVCPVPPMNSDWYVQFQSLLINWKEVRMIQVLATNIWRNGYAQTA